MKTREVKMINQGLEEEMVTFYPNSSFFFEQYVFTFFLKIASKTEIVNKENLDTVIWIQV